MQPQPGTTFKIFKVSSPLEISQNLWLIVEFWGEKPKSKAFSGRVSRGADHTDAAKAKTIAVNTAVLGLVFTFK
ncbi:MAG TPA: hypothetical protein VHP63_06210 [candidate division Zixibacteria bacterium]|nr:hypothetical protein [candidate division Zixibacteria bacterium]